MTEALEDSALQDVKNFSFADDGGTAGSMGPCVTAVAALDKVLRDRARLTTKYWKVLRGAHAPSTSEIL